MNIRTQAIELYRVQCSWCDALSPAEPNQDTAEDRALHLGWREVLPNQVPIDRVLTLCPDCLNALRKWVAGGCPSL